ncbi:hypothetical protein JCGZ_11386 [Jatropha curcas]|uniref:Cytochrome P450 n=1 Tax=Jatropha curcas TaxID=180498 RepID=A0A067KFG7_JATCU|nr:cytochrome P450 71A26 [Jatropha curcas]KDP31010.1 hypothetical protein JCGZ_11386 [Jatropha curcas]
MEISSITHQLQPLYVSVLCFLFFAYFLIKWLTSLLATQKNSPPSPPKIPILGNLHQLGLHPHRSLMSLGQRYGPLMMLHFGSKPVLIVSSAEAAREIMKTHDLVFANRPKLSVTDKLLYNSKDVASAPYGEYWRQMRSICVLHLLTNKRVQSFKNVREEEVNFMIEKIHKFSSSSLPVNLSEMFACLANDVICRVAFGKKYRGEDGKKFQKLLGEFMRLLGSFDVAVFIPWLSWIHWISGFDAKADRTAKEFDEFIEGILEEHINNGRTVTDGKEVPNDFVHVLLELQKESNNSKSEFSLERENIKALILDMFVGGSDTSSTVLEWAMTELIRHPRAMKKLQSEIKAIAPEKSNITEADLDKMQYLKLVIKEALRFHVPFPLLAARECMQDINILGFQVPAGTMVLINAWALARDSKLWSKPEEFWPERFLDNPIDFKGHDFEFIPFGAGRRGCPGMPFAMSIIELVLANLVNNFEWELPGGMKGEDLDVDESVGITTSRKNPLLAIAIPISH